MKIRDIVVMFEEDGWVLARTRGRHRQCKHLRKSSVVMLAGNPGEDLAPGILDSVLKQAGLKKAELKRWL